MRLQAASRGSHRVRNSERRAHHWARPSRTGPGGGPRARTQKPAVVRRLKEEGGEEAGKEKDGGGKDAREKEWWMEGRKEK